MKHIKRPSDFINESDDPSGINEPSGIQGLQAKIADLRDFRKRVDVIKNEIMDLFMDLKDDGYSVVITSNKNSWIDWNKCASNNINVSISSDKIVDYLSVDDVGHCITVGIYPERYYNINDTDALMNIDDSFINTLKFAESYAKKELGLEIGQIYVNKPFLYKYYKSIDSLPKGELSGVEIAFKFIIK